MSTTHVDLHNYCWLDHESVGFPDQHARALLLFRDSLVRPSLLAVEHEIEANALNDHPGAEFFESDLADLFQSTVEGYILTVQSMWERAFRSTLIHREKKLCGGQQVETLQRASWTTSKGIDLQRHFERLFGVPVGAFDSYEDLDLLQNLGSAIRHGDGAAARKVHLKAPSLWWNWLPPGESYTAGPFTIDIPKDWPEHPSFNKITLTQQVLEQMIQSVADFWEDMEDLRCSSFKNKHETTQSRLDKWPEKRKLRKAQRVWSPG